jgi:hypothetical protein
MIKVYKLSCKNLTTCAPAYTVGRLASSPIINPGRRGAGKAPKCHNLIEGFNVDEKIKKRKERSGP